MDRYYVTAEKICRREYEKRFGFDLSFPIGHPKNAIKGTSADVNIQLYDICKFWDELGRKYAPENKVVEMLVKKSHPLQIAVYMMCENHKLCCLKLLYDTSCPSCVKNS